MKNDMYEANVLQLGTSELRNLSADSFLSELGTHKGTSQRADEALDRWCRAKVESTGQGVDSIDQAAELRGRVVEGLRRFLGAP